MIQLLRSCELDFPDGKQFGEWGSMWGYHFDASGQWVKGQTNHLGNMMGQHGGVDIKCPEGTRQFAPADGILSVAGWQDPSNPKRGYGLHIIINMGEFLLTGGHFSQLFVTAGKKVERGQVIGLSGITGNASGPHIHWQLEKPGHYPRNPLAFEWVTV